MKHITQRSRVKPLTRCNRAGVPYQRTPEVISQIEATIELSPAQLIHRAQTSDKQSSNYLKEEVLVYYIREYYQDGQEDIVNELAIVLLKRCGKYVRSWLRALSSSVIDEACNDVIADLFHGILDLQKDHGDYLQVRFWHRLKRLKIDVFRRYSTRAANEKTTDNFSTLESSFSEASEEGADLVFEERVPNADLSVEDSVLLREALGVLEEPYRTAYLLRNGEGWQIESDDPDVPTIAEYFRKTPRTIRNWLAIAETQLKGWRNEREKDA